MILAIRLPYLAAAAIRHEYRLAADVPIGIAYRSKIMATCERAAARGILVNLTVRQARSIVPELVVIEDNHTLRERALTELLETLAEFTPRLESQSISLHRGHEKLKLIPDEQQAMVIYADFERLRATDVQHLADQIGQTVHSVLGLSPGLGIATGKFPAYVAAYSGTVGNPSLIPSGTEGEFLTLMPVTLLPLDTEMYRRLVTLGLVTLGQLAGLSQEALVMQFGAYGFFLHRLAKGRDDRPVIPYRASQLERVSRDCEESIANQLILEALLRSMATELAAHLQAKGRMGKTLTLTVRFEDRTVRERQMVLRQPLSNAAHFVPKLMQLLARLLPIQQGIVALEVTVQDLIPLAGEQLDLFIHQAAQRDSLTEVLNTLSTRYGPKQFLWVRPLDPNARRIEQRYRLHSLDEL